MKPETGTNSTAEAAVAEVDPKSATGVQEQSSTDAPAGTPAGSSFAAEDAELERVQAEEKAAREAAGKATESGTAATGDAGTQAASAAAAKPGDAATTKSVADATADAAAAGHNASQAAIIALRRQNSELKGALLVKQGENQVLKALVDPTKFAEEAGDVETAAQPSPEQQELDELAAERVRLAGEVDAGRLTMTEYAEQTNAIGAREREVAAAQTQQAIADASRPTNDLGLQEHLTSLVGTYPILNTLTAAELAPFKDLAYAQAARDGTPIGTGPVGTKQLRERMGALATQFYGGAKAEPAADATNTGAGTGASPGTSTQPTAAQREAKLALAGSHPPDISATGTGNTGGEPSEAQAEAVLMGNEDAALAWMARNPAFAQKQIGKR